MDSINKILKKEIELIKPDKEILEKINKISREFCIIINKTIKNKKIDAEVFIGGSLAKGTLVKKKGYDVDMFVRFNEKYGSDKISNLLGKILNDAKIRNFSGKVKKVHGSRDYYQIAVQDIILEIIPVLKIKHPDEAKNVMDLSYFHVNYIKKTKNKFSEDIIFAKVFADAQNCYGAESYINGFSGYAIELLICHYKSFLRFIQQIAKSYGKEKIIIDDSNFYKKNEILRELNESKIQSPIILIDPTFKERNVLAGLSQNTFIKFQKSCREFLKKPSKEFFEKKNILEGFDKKSRESMNIVSIKTNKQAGDIAGTKSKKFFNFFASKIKREFEIKKCEFEYNEDKNTAFFYFVLDKKKDEIIRGPPIKSVKHLTEFKKVHPKAFIKNHIAYVKLAHNLNFKEFFKKFIIKEKKIIKEMSINEINLLK